MNLHGGSAVPFGVDSGYSGQFVKKGIWVNFQQTKESVI